MCVFTDKNKKALAFALVPIIAINVYTGCRMFNKTSKDTEELKQQSNNEVVAKDLDVNAKNVLVKEKEAKIDVKTTKEKENNKK